MSGYKAIAKTVLEVIISDDQVAKILKKQLEDYFGLGKDVSIKDGYLTLENHPSKADGIIREATEEEIELYNAFKKVENYFDSK